MGPCHLRGGPGWGAGFLALVWFSPGYCGQLWVLTSKQDIYHSAFQIKQSFKRTEKVPSFQELKFQQRRQKI